MGAVLVWSVVATASSSEHVEARGSEVETPVGAEQATGDVRSCSEPRSSSRKVRGVAEGESPERTVVIRRSPCDEKSQCPAKGAWRESTAFLRRNRRSPEMPASAGDITSNAHDRAVRIGRIRRTGGSGTTCVPSGTSVEGGSGNRVRPRVFLSSGSLRLGGSLARNGLLECGAMTPWTHEALSGASYSAAELSDDDARLFVLDQRRLPVESTYLTYEDVAGAATSIRDMVVRGAPAIGITAAYGMTLAARAATGRDVEGYVAAMQEAGEQLEATRPTAANLAWAVERSGIGVLVMVGRA